MNPNWKEISGAAILAEADAPPLVRKAAAELRAGLERACGLSVPVLDFSEWTGAEPGQALFMVGQTRRLAEITGQDFPAATEEDAYFLHSIRWKGSRALLAGGGSERAVLYAVNELLRLYGVRFFISGDVDPAGKVPFRFPELRLLKRPAVRRRLPEALRRLARKKI